jgi:hypothetical protein
MGRSGLEEARTAFELEEMWLEEQGEASRLEGWRARRERESVEPSLIVCGEVEGEEGL